MGGVRMNDLAPNKSDISAHLYALFDPAFVQSHPDAWIEIAYCRPDGKLDKAGNFSAFKLEEAVEFAIKQNAAGNNVYVGAALRHGDKPARGRANGDHVVTASHAWMEYDDAGDDERIQAILKEHGLKPALVVTTGTVPHARRHLYFKLDGAITPEKLKEANTALCKLLGSDAVHDRPRVMRLAGTVNYPKPDKVGRGYVAELTTLIINKDARGYKADELIKLAPTEATSVDHIADYGKEGSPGRTDAELIALLKASQIKDWHNNMRDATATMIGRNMSDSAIKIACAAYCEGEAQDADLKVLIDTGRKTFNKPEDKDSSSLKNLLICTAAGAPKPLLANAITALRNHTAWAGVLSYNEFALHLSIDKAPPWHKSSSAWIPRAWSEQDDLLLTDWLHHQRIGVSVATAAQAVETVGRDRSFHPIRDYLDRLKHDRIPRVGSWLSDFLGAEESEYTKAVGQAILVGAVARIRNPGCKLDTIPILEGEQGALKSTAVKVLFDPWFTDELADFGSKDAAMQTCGVWGIEVSELSGMSRSEVARVKAFASRTVDRYRPPYGRRIIESKRSCIMIGTTNSDDYLKDETGGRRFWPIKVGKIDIPGLRKGCDQLWAEAQALYAAGTPWWITDAGVQADAEAEQRDRYIGDAWDEVIASHAADVDEVSVDRVLRDVLSLELKHCGQLEKTRVARVLVSLGLVRRQRGSGAFRRWVYVRPGDEDGAVRPERSGKVVTLRPKGPTPAEIRALVDSGVTRF
jgi:predicted P-loop ATPase